MCFGASRSKNYMLIELELSICSTELNVDSVAGALLNQPVLLFFAFFNHLVLLSDLALFLQAKSADDKALVVLQFHKRRAQSGPGKCTVEMCRYPSG